LRVISTSESIKSRTTTCPAVPPMMRRPEI
jgi:hypothetical protein